MVGKKTEVRRQENTRRDLNRVFNLTPIVRRPEPRRQERPLIRRPEIRRPQEVVVRRPEPRRQERPPIRQPTQQLPRLLIPPKQEKQGKLQIKQQIRKPNNYLLTPTITQKIYKVRRLTKAKRITGFEALRI
jgi:hypothetical protein